MRTVIRETIELTPLRERALRAYEDHEADRERERAEAEAERQRQEDERKAQIVAAAMEFVDGNEFVIAHLDVRELEYVTHVGPSRPRGSVVKLLPSEIEAVIVQVKDDEEIKFRISANDLDSVYLLPRYEVVPTDKLANYRGGKAIRTMVALGDALDDWRREDADTLAPMDTESGGVVEDVDG